MRFTYPEEMPQDEIEIVERWAARFVSFNEVDKNALMNDLQNVRLKERNNHLGWESDD